MKQLVILIFALQSTVFGQSFSNQVYRLAEGYSDSKCEAFAECDCCSGDLFLLSADKFCLISRCISGDSYFSGAYSVKLNKLKLTFDKKFVSEITDADYNVIGLDTKHYNTSPLEFDITKCGSKIHLTGPVASEWRHGSRYEQKRDTEMIKGLMIAEAWKKLSN
jgi:hypothetical protein